MASRWSRGMPVVVEPIGGGPRGLVIVADHVCAAILVGRGYSFPRVDDVRRVAAELEDEIDGERDDIGCS